MKRNPKLLIILVSFIIGCCGCDKLVGNRNSLPDMGTERDTNNVFTNITLSTSPGTGIRLGNATTSGVDLVYTNSGVKVFRPHTYFVSIPLDGRSDGGVIFKTRPPAVYGTSNTPSRIDGLAGIGATVWTEEEWRDLTTSLRENGMTNFEKKIIDLTVYQK